MGKHEAPEPPVKQKVHILVRLCAHHGTHVASLVILHVIAFVFATPILVAIGVGGGSH